MILRTGIQHGTAITMTESTSTPATVLEISGTINSAVIVAIIATLGSMKKECKAVHTTAISLAEVRLGSITCGLGITEVSVTHSPSSPGKLLSITIRSSVPTL